MSLETEKSKVRVTTSHEIGHSLWTDGRTVVKFGDSVWLVVQVS